MFKNREVKYAYWRDIMEQHEASGKSQKAFCKANKLSFRKFKYYRYHLQKLDKEVQVEVPLLVPVKLSEPFAQEETQVLAICELRLPNGLQLTLSQRDLSKTTAHFIKELLSC